MSTAPTGSYTFGHMSSPNCALPIWALDVGAQHVRIDAVSVEEVGLGRPAGAAGVAAVGGGDQRDEGGDVGRGGVAEGEVGHIARVVMESWRSEEHTSELQSLMRISYAVFCLKKKRKKRKNTSDETVK